MSNKRKVRDQRVWKIDDLAPLKANFMKANAFLHRMQGGDTGNPFTALKEARKHLESMRAYVLMLSKLNASLTKSQLLQDSGLPDHANSNLAWTDEDNEYLIQSRAEGQAIEVIANALGRTASSCATRLSTLVGISRELYVERYVDGELDGSEVSGLFKGMMLKKSS